MLELLISTVHRFISSLTNVTVLRFHEGGKVTMCQLNHIPLTIRYPWEEDISIIQDVEGIRWAVEKYHRLLPRALLLLEKERGLCLPKDVRNSGHKVQDLALVL